MCPAVPIGPDEHGLEQRTPIPRAAVSWSDHHPAQFDAPAPAKTSEHSEPYEGIAVRRDDVLLVEIGQGTGVPVVPGPAQPRRGARFGFPAGQIVDVVRSGAPECQHLGTVAAERA